MFFIEKVGSRIGAHRCRREKGRDAMKKIEWAVLLLAGLAIGAPAHGDDEFDALTSGYDQKVSEWYERLAEAQTEDGTYDAAKIPPHPAEEYVRAFEAYAKKHARTPKAVRALVWIAGVGAKNAPSGKGLAAGKAALGVLAEHHAADGVLGEVISELVFAWGHIGWEPMRSFYERVLAENKDDAALSWACFGLGFLIYNQNLDPQREEPADLDEAIRLFRRTVKEFEGTSAADWAEGFLFELEHLQIGQKAPEIVGEDVDGNEIKLSDFLGRVVVIDFWGFW